MQYRRVKGSRRYKCADCGSTQFETTYAMNLRNRPHCKGCGGTFLEPDTEGADQEFVKSGTARAIVEPISAGRVAMTGRENVGMQGSKCQ